MSGPGRKTPLGKLPVAVLIKLSQAGRKIAGGRS